MRHKHYDVIVAWAEGKEIEYQTALGAWHSTNLCPLNEYETYRIKPEPRPDVVKEYYAEHTYVYESDFTKHLRLTFDGGTGKLKQAEVISD